MRRTSPETYESRMGDVSVLSDVSDPGEPGRLDGGDYETGSFPRGEPHELATASGRHTGTSMSLPFFWAP
jgi:hypothetical protein